MRSVAPPSCALSRRALLVTGLVAGCQAALPGLPPLRLSADQEQELGTRALPSLIDAGGGAYPSASVQQAMGEVLRPLAALATRSLPWRALVLDDPPPRLMAVPGGTILVARGLVRLAASEDGLVAALAHALAHLEEAHAARLEQAASVEGLIQLVQRGHGPTLEAAADQRARALLVQAGRSPRRAAGLFEVLARVEPEASTCLVASAADASQRSPLWQRPATAEPPPLAASPAFQQLKITFPTPRALPMPAARMG
ncbi:MAG: hypothetical protein EAZ99_09470 [Alphaproteobacteria bacterium]|nr:MAG: hypothetical protein EAZ99_09470 [Alphaproteobacteria bacterium]